MSFVLLVVAMVGLTLEKINLNPWGQTYTGCPRIQISTWGQTYTFYKKCKTNMTINSIRKILYWISKTLGDINAVSKGKAGKRVARRATGKATGKAFKKILK